MDTTKLLKLVAHYKRISDEVKEAEAAHKEKLKEPKALLAKIQAKLATYIHKEEGGIQKLTLPDSSATAYARYEDLPKLVDRTEVEDWVLEGLDISEKDMQTVKNRMAIFGNTMIKDVVTQHRIDTGALEENGLLEGGDLPPGVGIFRKKEVRVVKSK